VATGPASGSAISDDTLLSPDASAAPAARTPHLLPGSTVSHYEIGGRLGAGAMGTVYRARDKRLGREVAIKLRPQNVEGHTSCRLLCSLLNREAQVMASLSHENLLGVYDIGEHRGCVFLALELVEGTTLREWTVGRPPDERVAALRAAGRGLAAAHGAGVIHRDFKPDNVLVSTAGKVKVADFGLARSRDQVLSWGVACGGCGAGEAGAELAREVDASMAGTPRYMAPAQLDGEPGDELADQYAFGVTAWELVFDVYPFAAARTIGELRAAQSEGPATPDGVDEALVRTLRRALSPSASARHPSMEALLAELG
jgi:serine/threonine protein kinase